jgi:hypothetical protein
MSSLVLSDAKIWVATYDLSGDLNQVALEEQVDAKDATTFGQTHRVRKGGQGDVLMGAAGFFNATGSSGADDVLPPLLGLGNNLLPISIGPEGAAEGNTAYCFPGLLTKYEVGARVGEMFGFRLEARTVRSISGVAPGRPRLARGKILLSTQKTTTGSGTAFQLGAVSATQKLYVMLHAIATAGGTPTIRVQSDNASGFPSPTTRATITATSDWQVIAGPITDDWWRADWTFAGTSFTAIVIAAIR